MNYTKQQLIDDYIEMVNLIEVEGIELQTVDALEEWLTTQTVSATYYGYLLGKYQCDVGLEKLEYLATRDVAQALFDSLREEDEQ